MAIMNIPAIHSPDDALSFLSSVEANLAILYALGPDGSLDRLRTLGDTGGEGLGVLAAAPRTPGASEVLTDVQTVASTSVTRATAITPTSGRKVRIVSVSVATFNATGDPGRISVYFGTGVNYNSSLTKGITEGITDIEGFFSQAWPDGGGPVGAVDEVVSWKTEAETDTAMRLTTQYREE